MPQIAAALTRPINTWFDLSRDGRGIAVFVVLFVAVWTTFQIISYWSIDLHPDLIEAYIWGQHPAAGYAKHPPMVGWVAAAWFTVFPAADWAFHLLAMCNAAVGLFATDLIARRYVSGDKRLLVLLLLLLLPFYQFHGQRFGANPILLSTWPIATYCFLRAFESRGIAWSVAAGFTAAIVMLSKYYSVYLVGAVVLAALSHPARWAYLRSPAPWVSIVAGVVALAPHLAWYRTASSNPFEYAYAIHGTSTMSLLLYKAGAYVVGGVLYAAVAFLAYAWAVRPDWPTLKDTFWPADQRRRMLVILLAGMLLLPVPTAPLMGLELTPLWTIAAWFLLPIVLLAPERAKLPRARAVGVALLVGAIAAGSLLAAPVLAWTRHVKRDPEDRAYYRLASAALARQWRAATAQPLRIVLGAGNVGAATAFYHPDHPDIAGNFDLRTAPSITPERIAREGLAAICHAEDAVCIAAAEQHRTGRSNTTRANVELARHFLGHAGPPARFTIFVVPPPSPPPTAKAVP
jgi:4-amino-4-deoxy-L-arabinose transferase-like glycosyltransferase